MQPCSGRAQHTFRWPRTRKGTSEPGLVAFWIRLQLPCHGYYAHGLRSVNTLFATNDGEFAIGVILVVSLLWAAVT